MKKSEYHSEDITFCISRCNRKSCHRHKSNIRDFSRLHSVADLKGSVYCELKSDKKDPRHGN